MPYGNQNVPKHILFGVVLDCRHRTRHTYTEAIYLGAGHAQVDYGGRPADSQLSAGKMFWEGNECGLTTKMLCSTEQMVLQIDQYREETMA